MKSIFLCEAAVNFNWVYPEKSKEYIKENFDCDGIIYDKEAVMKNKEKFAKVRYIFSTWVMAKYTEAEIKAYFPKLECIFYAAGTVQDFAIPFLNCGVKIFSASSQNAIPVAEFTAAQIVLANVGYYGVSRLYSAGNVQQAKERFSNYPGNYGVTVGLLGAGAIGKAVIRLLKPYHLQIIVFDPFLPDAVADDLGVKKVSIEELFCRASVISNHLANNDATKNIINKSLLEKMPPYATFINTGRGAQVVEEDLAAVLTERQDITALLDVTVKEPPEENSKLYALDNCILSPHIAGSSGNEVWRLSSFMIDECNRYERGENCGSEVKTEMLKTMA